MSHNNNPSKLCIRVRYNGQIKCLELDWNEISSDAFTNQLISTFDVKIQSELEPVWVLTDNLDMPISKHQFENVLKTFHSGSMFFINADLQPTNIKGAIQMVTPLMLENYLIQSNNGNLLEHRKSKTLDEKTYHAISVQLADFAVQAFGFDEISYERKKWIAAAAIKLFVGMKYTDSKGDGTEKILTRDSQFCNRLKYLIGRHRKQQKSEATAAASESEANDDVDQSSPEDDLVYLKEAIIDQIDDQIIKQKLNSTRALRHCKMSDLKFDIRESLPFFLSHPRLVAMDFMLSYQEANDNALSENWPQYSTRLREICTLEPKYKFTSGWSQEIEDVLRLLKVLPSKGKSCEKLFSNTCMKLISFRVKGTPPDKMIIKANKSPYIVATGFNQKEVDSFFIVVEEHLIPLPKEFGIADVLDMLFKIHIVLNIKFDVNLHNMMMFLETLVYKFQEKKGNFRPSSQMLNIYDRLNESDN